MISSLAVHVHDVQDVEIIIDGSIKASKNHDQWKNSIEKCPDPTKHCKKVESLMNFMNVEDIVFRGKGEIDG